MKGRTLTDWITAYLDYTEETEPPRAYHRWVAVSMIAGALQRKVGMRWGHEIIYPNMYIILVGPSGRCRKGTALGIGKDLLQEVSGVTITSESITREALIRAMKGAVTNYTMPNGIIKWQCPITCVSPELSVFLGQQDIKFIAALTDWYDAQKEWTYETKGAGIDRIQGVCFNMLGATAPDWISSMLPQEALGGGFTSRCVFVVESNKAKSIPHPIFTDRMAELRLKLINDLQMISNLAQEANFNEEAKIEYEKWYQAEEAAIQKGKLPVDDARFAGYSERRATHVKKLSIILSASHSNDSIITAEDFHAARLMLEEAEVKMPSTFGGLGRSKYSEAIQTIIDYVKKHGSATRSEILGIYYRDIDSLTLKIVEEVLDQMKAIRITHDTMKSEVRYDWIGK